jgi:hypothetical protein
MGKRNRREDVFAWINMRPEPPCTCWLWTGAVNSKGIPYIQVDGRRYAAYRLVYKLTHPEWDIDNTREFILHSCVDEDGKEVDNPRCCRPDHLRPGTNEDNMIDMMRRGRKGLTKEVVLGIIGTVKEHSDWTHSQVAAYVSYEHKVNVSRQAVTDIVGGRRRKVLLNFIDERNRRIDGVD